MTNLAESQAQGRQNLEEIQQRLTALQAPLGEIVTQALTLNEEIFPAAPRPMDMPKGFPVWGIETANIEPTTELIVRLPGEKELVIHKHPLAAPPGYPQHGVRFSRPYKPGKRRHVQVHELAGHITSFGIETSIWSDGVGSPRYLELVDAGYADKDGDIQETKDAIQEAGPFARAAIKQLTTWTGSVTGFDYE